MFKSHFQIAGEALAIAALSASAAAQNPQAPTNTFTDLPEIFENMSARIVGR